MLGPDAAIASARSPLWPVETRLSNSSLPPAAIPDGVAAAILRALSLALGCGMEDLMEPCDDSP